MESTLAFTLGALVAAAKALGIAAVGFGIAWWRAKRRIDELEDERPHVAMLEQRLARLESSVDSVVTSVDRLVTSQNDVKRLLEPGPTDQRSK